MHNINQQNVKSKLCTSIISGLKLSNFCIASLTKTNTSPAANSLLSDKNSIRTGITAPATSGNLIQQECRVLTSNCLYFPVSSCSESILHKQQQKC